MYRESLFCDRCRDLTSFMVNHGRAVCETCGTEFDYGAALLLWKAAKGILDAERRAMEEAHA